MGIPPCPPTALKEGIDPPPQKLSELWIGRVGDNDEDAGNSAVEHKGDDLAWRSFESKHMPQLTSMGANLFFSGSTAIQVLVDN